MVARRSHNPKVVSSILTHRMPFSPHTNCGRSGEEHTLFGACVAKLHLSYLVAFQLHSCSCKHHRRNSNILQCCSLGLCEDAPCSGRHKRTDYLQYRRCVAVGAFSSCLVFSTRFPSICLPSTALFRIGFHPPLLHPPKIKVRGRERDFARKAAQQQDPRGFIRQQDCHDSIRRPCARIIASRCDVDWPAIHSGNH